MGGYDILNVRCRYTTPQPFASILLQQGRGFFYKNWEHIFKSKDPALNLVQGLCFSCCPRNSI